MLLAGIYTRKRPMEELIPQLILSPRYLPIWAKKLSVSRQETRVNKRGL